MLIKRFGVKTITSNETARMIDADSLGQNKVFVDLLKYINTREEKQKKGNSGDVK